MLGNAGTFDSWLHTLYFGMNLPGSMVRSMADMATPSSGGDGGGGDAPRSAGE